MAYIGKLANFPIKTPFLNFYFCPLVLQWECKQTADIVVINKNCKQTAEIWEFLNVTLMSLVCLKSPTLVFKA